MKLELPPHPRFLLWAMRILGTILLKPFPFLGSHVGGPSSFTALRGPLPPGPQPPWKESCISCLSYIAVRLFLNIVAILLPEISCPRTQSSVISHGSRSLPRATKVALVFPHLLLPHHDGQVDRVLSVLWFFWNRL